MLNTTRKKLGLVLLLLVVVLYVAVRLASDGSPDTPAALANDQLIGLDVDPGSEALPKLPVASMSRSESNPEVETAQRLPEVFPVEEPIGERVIEFLILELNSAPVSGALVCEPGSKSLCSELSDDEGRARINRVGHEPIIVQVGAPGFQVLEVEIDAAQHDLANDLDPIVVYLERETLLTLKLRREGGLSLKGLQLELRTTDELFHRPGVRLLSIQQRAGTASFPIGGGGRGDEYLVFRLDTAPNVVVSGLREEQVFGLTLFDQYHWPLHKEDLLPLQRGEWREVEIVLPGSPRTFTCRVRDESGNPIAGARVAFSFQEGITSSLQTDLEGRTTISDLWAPKGKFSISKSSYVPLRWDEYVFPVGGHAEFQLVRGNRVEVLVTDPQGNPADAWIQASVQGYGGFNVLGSAEAGYSIDGLPAGIVLIDARVGNTHYTLEHDTLTPVAEIRVPAHGSIEVQYQEAPPEGGARFIGLIPVGRESDHLLENASGTSCTFEWVLPGDYELCFKDYAGERGREVKDVSARVSVTVRAGESSRVLLER